MYFWKTSKNGSFSPCGCRGKATCACAHTPLNTLSGSKHWKEPEICDCTFGSVDLLCAFVHFTFGVFCSFKQLGLLIFLDIIIYTVA